LLGKGGLAAVEGVGPAAAEQAVGFVRVPGTPDPRDRTQLHPEQYALLDAMAKQLDADVATLFREPRARAHVDLAALSRPEGGGGERSERPAGELVGAGAPAGAGRPDRGPGRPDDRRGGPPRGRGGAVGGGAGGGERRGEGVGGRRAGAPLRGTRGEGARER